MHRSQVVPDKYAPDRQEDKKKFVAFETWHSFQETCKIMNYNYFVAQNIKIFNNTERHDFKKMIPR
jgi:hypothetical protein